MATCIVQLYLYYIYYIYNMSWLLSKLLGKGNGYKEFEDKELEEFDESAVALNAAIEAAEITAKKSGEISDQIAFVKLLLKKEPGNQSYIQNLQDLKAKAAVLAAEAEADRAEGSEGSGSEGSVNFADDGGKKSRYSRKSKSKYSRKSKSKYSRKSKSKLKSKYSRKSKSKYSRKSKSKY